MVSINFFVGVAFTNERRLLAGLDDVVDALQIAVSRKPGNKDAIKQELEKIDDLIRSAMRGLNALRKIPDAGVSHHVAIGGVS
jgi:hypothetical protein